MKKYTLNQLETGTILIQWRKYINNGKMISLNYFTEKQPITYYTVYKQSILNVLKKKYSFADFTFKKL